MTEAPIERLAPCPFCGGDARLFPSTLKNQRHFDIACTQCEAGTTTHDSEASAIAAWNRRAAPQHPEGTVEAVARALLEHDIPHTSWETELQYLREEYRDLARAALSAMPGVPDGWRPISEAPKEQEILVYLPKARNGRKFQIAINQKIANGHVWLIGGHFGFDVSKPTLWQPISAPLPPEDKP